MSVLDLPRGEDLARDERLDLYYGRISIGPTVYRGTELGGLLIGHRVRIYGYDGTVLSDEESYTTRLYW